MNLFDFRKQAGLSQAKFAELMTAAGFPATQALISQWEGGGVTLTAERCAQIESVTKGEVTRGELRPDLFGPLPEMAGDDGGPQALRRRSAASTGVAATEATPVVAVDEAA